MTTPKKKLWPVSRRAFMSGLGAVGFSHLLPSGRLAHAQTGGPKRFVAIYVPEGMWAGVQRPNATSFGPVFGPMDKHCARRSSRSTGSLWPQPLPTNLASTITTGCLTCSAASRWSMA